MKLSFEENMLTDEQCVTLRESVGWTSARHQIKKALEKGLYNVKALDGDRVIAMGRLVGDGIMYWYLQDVIVLPEYQGKGIGRQIVSRLICFIKENSMPGTTVTIALMSAKGKENFYEKQGFITRPNASMGAGMIKHLTC